MGLPLLMASVGAAQTEPEFFSGIGDVQIFDQPDLSTYGSGVPPRSGWFGSAELLTWAVSSPERATIGLSTPVPVWFPGAVVQDTGTPPVPPGNPSGVGVTQGTILNPALQFSSLDTGFMDVELKTGTRFELGYIDEGGLGWFLSTFTRFPDNETLTLTNVAINFDNSPVGFIYVTRGGQTFHEDLDLDNVYGAFGRDRGTRVGNNFVSPNDRIPDPEDAGNTPLPTDFDDAVPLATVFNNVIINSRVETWGVEANRLMRVTVGRYGGVWEIFGGPRYFAFNDRFGFEAFRDAIAANAFGFFNDITMNMEADNNIVGGQIGTRYSIIRGRTGLVVEGRYMPAANFQSIRQRGTVEIFRTTVPVAGQADIINFGNAAFTNSIHPVEFSNVGELRVKGTYQLFRNVTLTAGWTGIFADGVARSSNMVVYRLPTFGINPDENRQNVFINGLDVGVSVNR